MEKALTSAAITAATSALGALFGGGAGASIGGGAVGAFLPMPPMQSLSIMKYLGIPDMEL